MFSVVIPLYNKEKFVAATISSVLVQSFTQFELIIVDDESTDSSINVAESFLTDKRVKIIKQRNGGVSAARNNGIRNAHFPFIAFLDADDLWHPQFLEQMRNAIELFPEAAIWGADYKWIFPDEKIEFEKLEHPKSPVLVKDYFNSALRNLIFCSSASVVKKSALEQTGLFNESLKAGEDLDFWFRILLSFEGVHIPVPLALYMRLDGEQVEPGVLPPLKYSLIGRAFELYEKQLKKPQQVSFRKFMYNYVLSNLIFYYFDPKYKNDAIAVLKSIALSPKLRRPRFILYFLPYNLANKLYQKLRRTKG